MMRRALTLIELLVVLVIITLVTAAAIPMMAPQGDSRRQREAARMVASFLQGARSRAIETGRPVGVVFEWFPPGQQAPQQFAMNLAYGAVPPPYSGDMADAVCSVTNATVDEVRDTFGALIGYSIKLTVSTNPSSSFNTKLIRIGDMLRFNFQGGLWEIRGTDSDNDGFIDGPSINLVYPRSLSINNPSDVMLAAIWRDAATRPNYANVPYQIFRQPVRSASGPIQLPEGAVVDLTLTGHGIDAFALDNWATITAAGRPIEFVITFSPDGSVERTNYLPTSGTALGRTTDVLSIMIGKREKVIASDNAAGAIRAQFNSEASTLAQETQMKKYNFKDPDNFWVVVNPSGTIVTGEVGASTETDFFKALEASRQFARKGENAGAR